MTFARVETEKCAVFAPVLSCIGNVQQSFRSHPKEGHIILSWVWWCRRSNRGGSNRWWIGTQTHLPQKFSFSSDFGHFVLKMLKIAKKYTFLGKKYINIQISGGGDRPPRGFQKCGALTPAIPLSTTSPSTYVVFWFHKQLFYGFGGLEVCRDVEGWALGDFVAILRLHME